MKLYAKYYTIEDAKIGENTIIRDFVNIFGCTIGDHCKVGTHVDIQKGVVIGDNCKIEPFSFIPTGVTIEDDVFIGHHVCFTNDKTPEANDPTWKPEPTLVKKGASLGANSTILCGITIGEYAFIGAGAVVNRDVPDYALAFGVPARIKGWMCFCGAKLTLSESPNGEEAADCQKCGRKYKKKDLKIFDVSESKN